jgi:hypothetical protein
MRRLKVDKKLVTCKQSVAFTVAIALIALSNVALADSAYEWAYWDVSPSAGANSEPAVPFAEQVASIDTVKTYNGYNNITAEQMRIPVNNGESLEASDTPITGTWVGYAIYDTTSYSGVDGDVKETTSNNVAVLGITPGKESGTLTITSDLKGFNMGFDSKDNDLEYKDGPRDLSYGDQEGDVQAEYHGSQDANRIVETDAQSLNGEEAGKYITKIGLFNSETFGSLEIDALLRNGLGGFAGMTMSDADIAYQTQLGKSYTFKGDSLGGSIVNIDVDFAKATWRGEWGGAKRYDAFNAGGKITGETLTSSNVIGTSNTTSKTYVQGGNVTATLIGVLSAAASNAGIIGKTELNVGAVGTAAVKVNDVFAASIVPTK